MKIKPFKIIYSFIIVCLIALALLLVLPILPVKHNFKILAVLSGSMEPKIHVGSVVVIKPAVKYKVGEIITFNQEDKTKIPITHRIVGLKSENEKTIYITKGDANNNSDSQEIPQDRILGRMIFTVPYLGYAINFAKQPLGFMLLIVIPSVIIIYDEILKIKNEILKMKKKKILQIKKQNKNKTIAPENMETDLD